MTDPAVNPNVPIIGQDAEVTPEDAMDAVVLELVNFNARVMDYCVSAAQTIVKNRMTDLGHVTHGPDPGPSPSENPAVVPIATEIFKEVTTALREGNKRLQSECDDSEDLDDAAELGDIVASDTPEGDHVDPFDSDPVASEDGVAEKAHKGFLKKPFRTTEEAGVDRSGGETDADAPIHP